MAPLTAELVIKENQGQDPSSIKSLKLNLRAISDASFLGVFTNLEHLDVSCNNISSLEGLGSCANLKNLSVAQNKLTSLKGIQGLPKLTVLNAGQNMILSMAEVTSITSLRALIMNDNKISSIPKLEPLKFLNTLVLSKNPVANIGKALENMKSISKLSLSNCQIQEIGSSLVFCVDLKEARFAHNEITTLPNELSQNARLQVLDVGKNAISRWSDIRVLSSLQALKNLNLQGNPVTEINNLLKKVKKMLPRLKTFNAKPLDDEKRGKNDKDTPSFDRAPPRKPIHPPVNEKLMVRKSSAALGMKDDDSVVRTEAEDYAGNQKRKKQRTEGSIITNTVVPTSHTTNPFTLADIKAREEEAKKRKKKEKKGSDKSREFDDEESQFMDLSVPAEDAPAEEDSVARQRVMRPAHGEDTFFGGLVIDPMKKKKKKDKKALNNVKGLSALELLQSSEVGTGGPSTWD